MPLAHVFAAAIKPYLSAKRWLIAYSGGLDSTALLHLSVQLSLTQKTPPIIAVHVNHGLSPNALSWQQACEVQCSKLGVPMLCESVSVNNVGKGLEDAARTARYAAFSHHVKQGDVLMLAHHADDQAETLLYRLFRGAGVSGLAGIKATVNCGDGLLVRPLLSEKQADLACYIADHKLAYIDDESNTDEAFDRNFIRHTIVPSIAQRWPAATTAIQQATANLREAEAILTDVASTDLVACADASNAINIVSLLHLSLARQNNVLRHWFARFAVVPSAKQLGELREQFFETDQNAQPKMVFGEQVLLRFQKKLVCEPASTVDMSFVLPRTWDTAQPLELAYGASLRLDNGAGEVFDLLPLSGSMRFKPRWRTHSTSVKKLLQACQVPPWHRSALCALVYQGAVVAIPGIGFSEAFYAKNSQRECRLTLKIGEHFYLCE